MIAPPDGILLRRAARVTVVGTAVFAVVGWGFDQPIAALPAVFAVFTLGSLAVFRGPPVRRVAHQIVAGALGLAMIPLAAAVSVNPVLTVVATGIIAFAAFYASCLGGPFYAVRFPVAIAFLFAASRPEPTTDVAMVMASWTVGVVAITVGTLVLWPPRLRQPVREMATTVCRLAASYLGDDRTGLAELRAARDELRGATLAAHLRTGAPARGQRLLAEVVHQVERVVAAIISTTPNTAPGPAGRSLTDAVRSGLDAAGDALAGSASGPQAARRASTMLAGAMDDHLADLERRLAGADGSPAAPEVVTSLAPSVVLHRLGEATAVLACLVDRLVGGGAPPATAEIRPQDGPWATLADQFRPDNLWFRNATRAAVALMGSMVLVQLGVGGGHGFWVLFGTFSVLRADAASIAHSAMDSVVGTIGGLVVGVVVLTLAGDRPVVLAVLFPLALFAATEAGRFGPRINAGAFTVFLVVMFTLVRPEGYAIARNRLEAVSAGVLVTLVVGLVLWPKVSAVPAGALADIVRRCSDSLRAAVDGVATTRSPLVQLTAMDRLLDMLAASAPDAVAGPTRELLLTTVDDAVAATEMLRTAEAALGGRTGETEAALDIDARAATHALDQLGHRLLGEEPATVAPAGHGCEGDALSALAGRRLAAGGQDPSQVLSLVRLGVVLGLVRDLAARTPDLGLRYG